MVLLRRGLSPSTHAEEIHVNPRRLEAALGSVCTAWRSEPPRAHTGATSPFRRALVPTCRLQDGVPPWGFDIVTSSGSCRSRGLRCRPVVRRTPPACPRATRPTWVRPPARSGSSAHRRGSRSITAPAWSAAHRRPSAYPMAPCGSSDSVALGTPSVGRSSPRARPSCAFSSSERRHCHPRQSPLLRRDDRPTGNDAGASDAQGSADARRMMRGRWSQHTATSSVSTAVFGRSTWLPMSGMPMRTRPPPSLSSAESISAKSAKFSFVLPRVQS